MSLFSNAEAEKFVSAPDQAQGLTASRSMATAFQNNILNSFSSLQEHLSSVTHGESRLFFSDGSWSNYELMEFLLEITGPALVGFTTWSISEIAITRMNDWVSSGKILQLYGVLDNGIRNRKPHIFQQAISTLQNLKLTHCHAKVLSIVSPDISFLVVGSANFTKNPRKEAGVLICDRSQADFALEWIKSIVDGGDS